MDNICMFPCVLDRYISVMVFWYRIMLPAGASAPKGIPGAGSFLFPDNQYRRGDRRVGFYKRFMDYEQASHRGTETSMLVGGRLAVSDCSQVTDGAVVVVLVSERYIEAHPEYKDKPVVKGYGHRTAPMLFYKKMADSAESEYALPWTKQAVDDCYRRSEMPVDDIDCFETHDCFNSSEYAAISAFGLTEPGKEYEAVENGLIAFGGAKPINHSGGLIGCGHPVGRAARECF